MASFACPKCKKKLKVDEAKVGAVAACPGCGQKFRIPATERSQREEVPPEELDEEDVSPRPQKSRRRQAEEEDTDETDSDLEEVPRKKKKKKKNKKQKTAINPLVPISIMLGAALTCGGIAFFAVKFIGGGKKETAVDQGPIIALIKERGGDVEQDMSSPGQPVIGINLTASVSLTNADVKQFSALPKLRKLNLANTLADNVSLGWLEELKDLRYLNLANTKVSDPGMESLKGLTNLEELDLRNTSVTDKGLEHLEKLTKLRRIFLEGALARGLGLKEALPDLEIIK